MDIFRKDDKKFLGVCFKILLNYMQMIGIVASFDMKWPYYTRGYFAAQSGMGSFSTQLFSLDCLAKRLFFIILRNVKCAIIYLGYSIEVQVVYIKVLFASLMPLGILFFNNLYWLIAGKFFHKKNSFNMLYFTSIIIQFFLQPTVVKELTNPLLCEEIDGEYFIRNSMDVSCDNSTYDTWV